MALAEAVERLIGHVADEDARAVHREPIGDGEADARGAGRHEHALAGKALSQVDSGRRGGLGVTLVHGHLSFGGRGVR